MGIILLPVIVLAAVWFFLLNVRTARKFKNPTSRRTIWLANLASYPLAVYSLFAFNLSHAKFISASDGSVGPAFYVPLSVFLLINGAAHLIALYLERR